VLPAKTRDSTLIHDLAGYFNGVSDVLAAKAVVAGDSAENIDIGANREVICSDFLEKHVPRRFRVHRGGDVFGVGNARSGQIDVLITHDMSINFEENHKVRCAVESLTAAISIKSNLTKGELHSALRNLSTIPQCHVSAIQLGLLSRPVQEYVLEWPSLFVFAYRGVDLNTCVRHMAEFYEENAVPFNRIPRAIIVNREYAITFIHYAVQGATPETRFDPRYLGAGAVLSDKTNRGWPLFWLMTELAKGVTWLGGMYIDYSAYYQEAYRPST
jgi:hypothetical protein